MGYAMYIFATITSFVLRVYHVMHKYFDDNHQLEFEYIFEQTIGKLLVRTVLGIVVKVYCVSI